VVPKQEVPRANRRRAPAWVEAWQALGRLALARPAATAGRGAPAGRSVLRGGEGRGQCPSWPPGQNIIRGLLRGSDAGMFVLSFWAGAGLRAGLRILAASYRRSHGLHALSRTSVRHVAIGTAHRGNRSAVASALAYLMRFVRSQRGEIILQLVRISLFTATMWGGSMPGAPSSAAGPAKLDVPDGP